MTDPLPIVAINLATRADRRRDLERGLASVGIDPARIVWYPAIDPHDACGFMNRGYRGCYLSHLAVLNLARNAGWPHLLVLEDDCEFRPGFPEAFAAALARKDWELCFLGHGEVVESCGPGALIEWPSDRRVWQTHCYVVRGSVLPVLCAYLERMLLRPPGHPAGGPMSPDGVLGHFRRNHPEIRALLAGPRRRCSVRPDRISHRGHGTASRASARP